MSTQPWVLTSFVMSRMLRSVIYWRLTFTRSRSNIIFGYVLDSTILVRSGIDHDRVILDIKLCFDNPKDYLLYNEVKKMSKSIVDQNLHDFS